MLLNTRTALTPRVAPKMTVTIVAGRFSTASKGPSHEAGRARAMVVGGMVMF